MRVDVEVDLPLVPAVLRRTGLARAVSVEAHYRAELLPAVAALRDRNVPRHGISPRAVDLDGIEAHLVVGALDLPALRLHRNLCEFLPLPRPERVEVGGLLLALRDLSDIRARSPVEEHALLAEPVLARRRPVALHALSVRPDEMRLNAHEARLRDRRDDLPHLADLRGELPALLLPVVAAAQPLHRPLARG